MIMLMGLLAMPFIILAARMWLEIYLFEKIQETENEE